MRLYLINPSNPLVSTSRFGNGILSKFRTRKPLGLLIVAGLTPPEWEVTIIDENVRVPDYAALPLPDLVGITAFTAQAHRAYQIAAMFRGRGVPVVMGGIHATRGCPLRCDFCSVTAFNGGRYRQRPIEHVVQELEHIREKLVFIVDDNLIGTRKDHVSRTKELFRAMIDARLGKKEVGSPGDDQYGRRRGTAGAGRGRRVCRRAHRPRIAQRGGIDGAAQAVQRAGGA